MQTAGGLDRDQRPWYCVSGEQPLEMVDALTRHLQRDRVIAVPDPLLTQSLFSTFPGSTATITVAESTATPKIDMNRLPRSDS